MALPQRHDDRAPSTPEERSVAELALELTRGWAWEYDVATHEVYRSHDISTLLGKSAGAVLPTLDSYLEYVHPDDREKVRRAFRDAINNRTGYDIEYRVVLPDGIHWMAGRGRTLLDTRGKPRNVIGVDLDVTERKSLQQVVVDRERLVALGQISATLAHELNNPLSAVQNALYLLKESGGLSERQTNILAIAENEIRRAVEIIRSTLGIQRAASVPVAADLRSLVNEVLTLFEARLGRQKIHVKKNFREVPQLLVLPGQIRQVLVNLIGNAADAMPSGGMLAIGIAASTTNIGRAVRLLVCDSGPGITPEMQARVFEPFFTTKGHSGSGIGLWVSKQIIEMHGGEIRLRSCRTGERTGTCVSVSLPRRTGAGYATPPPPRP